MEKERECKCWNMALKFWNSLQTSCYKCESCWNNFLYNDIEERV